MLDNVSLDFAPLVLLLLLTLLTLLLLLLLCPLFATCCRHSYSHSRIMGSLRESWRRSDQCSGLVFAASSSLRARGEAMRWASATHCSYERWPSAKSGSGLDWLTVLLRCSIAAHYRLCLLITCICSDPFLVGIATNRLSPVLNRLVEPTCRSSAAQPAEDTFP